MTRPPLEVADLVRTAGTAFLERNRQWLRWTHIKVLLAIVRCRTAALGGHIDACTRCGHRAAISYNSCRNRHCPKCQTGARERWIQARRLQLHPHVHCVIPAGGLSLDRTRWIRSRPRFFLPIQVLRRVFRGKFVAGLKSAFQRGQLHLSGNLALLAQPKIFASWLRPLFRKDWIVYSKPPFGGPEYVLHYLGRYTH